MLTTDDPRRVLYTHARVSWDPAAAAALIEILTFGTETSPKAPERTALRSDLALLERDIASRELFDASMRSARWVTVLCVLTALVSLGLMVLLG